MKHPYERPVLIPGARDCFMWSPFSSISVTDGSALAPFGRISIDSSASQGYYSAFVAYDSPPSLESMGDEYSTSMGTSGALAASTPGTVPDMGWDGFDTAEYMEPKMMHLDWMGPMPGSDEWTIAETDHQPQSPSVGSIDSEDFAAPSRATLSPSVPHEIPRIATRKVQLKRKAVSKLASGAYDERSASKKREDNRFKPECKQCGKTFHRPHELDRHVKSAKQCPGRPETVGIACGDCGKILSRADALQRHRRSAACQRER
ncbi:hypothetical protein BKA62DRAFT_687368 [Auriculariales sp. MPI-PUGE-AT-0066]|nr:hypothetical protein BKA62DRAFT_687368 [Auriculariales sp. MPI-PUGE-AT-0066]